WYGAAPQSSDCVDIYGQVISAATGNPLPFARVEAFPGSATTSDANGNFRLATAANGNPKITASRVYIDTDGGVSGTPGAKIIEYGTLADIPLVGLVSRPCSDTPGTLPPGSTDSTEPGSKDNPMTLTIGNIGTVGYTVLAYLTDSTVWVTLRENIPNSDLQGDVVSGANIVLTGPNGFSITVPEFTYGATGSGFYTADIAPELGQKYTLSIDADNNGTVDGSGFVYIAGEINITSPIDGATVAADGLTMSWTDSANNVANPDPNYSATYWAYIYGATYNGTAFTFDTARYIGTNTSFTVKSSENIGENLLPGNYSATVLSFSGAYLPAFDTSYNGSLVNNITGPSVNGQFYVFSDFTGGGAQSIQFTVE
ncbi:MAG: hypothetical protein R3240_09340, partial [Gammaproteobacteria bacterium]|nr:hypothetical protein [Gammaproteobacteria bacterium]